ncbi:hypothetical protein HZA43_02670 [Candidatus Peregrinibacteria bacterium]|nr:hypothetical protein [Candidatus Peregrinibacteria bacterium]
MELNQRQRQLGEVLKQPFGDFFRNHLDPQEFGLTTVIDVIVSPNLAKVEIWLSCLGTAKGDLEKRLEQYVPELIKIVHRHIHQRRKLHLAFRIAD